MHAPLCGFSLLSSVRPCVASVVAEKTRRRLSLETCSQGRRSVVPSTWPWVVVNSGILISKELSVTRRQFENSRGRSRKSFESRNSQVMLLGYREVHHKDLECLISVCVLHSSNEIKNSRCKQSIWKNRLMFKDQICRATPWMVENFVPGENCAMSAVYTSLNITLWKYEFSG